MKMRIISGEFKGRLINVPKSELIRPMTDRVRETLFNLISNSIDLNGIRVLDIYSGSGSLGLECYSRGASEIQFVEKDYRIYKNLIENIKSLDGTEKCSITKMPALKFASVTATAAYDLILADPPFFKDDIHEVVNNLINNGYLHAESLMIIERSIQTKEKDIINFKSEPFKIIGDACLYKVQLAD